MSGSHHRTRHQGPRQAGVRLSGLLTGNQQRVHQLLAEAGPLTLDELRLASGMTVSGMKTLLGRLLTLKCAEFIGPDPKASGRGNPPMLWLARPVPAAANAVKQRPCLRCQESFRSEGPHNRLCDGCRGQSSGLPPQFAGHDSGSRRGAANRWTS